PKHHDIRCRQSIVHLPQAAPISSGAQLFSWVAEICRMLTRMLPRKSRPRSVLLEMLALRAGFEPTTNRLATGCRAAKGVGCRSPGPADGFRRPGPDCA